MRDDVRLFTADRFYRAEMRFDGKLVCVIDFDSMLHEFRWREITWNGKPRELLDQDQVEMIFPYDFASRDAIYRPDWFFMEGVEYVVLNFERWM